jgi:hypothetical protein
MLAIAGISARAQTSEPIHTKSAETLDRNEGSLKFDYAGDLLRSRPSSEVIPEATLELGLRKGLEGLLRFPLLRVTVGNRAIIAGGQLAAGGRYLLLGGLSRSYAISVQAIVETPTGDGTIVGNATQVMPSLLAEWHLGRLALHSNFTFDRSIGGTRRSGFRAYENAVAWCTTARYVPVLEFVSSTNAITHRTQVIAQPELIIRIFAHLEYKMGVQLGVNSAAPPIGLRIQFAAFWGKRR